MFLGMTPG